MAATNLPPQPGGSGGEGHHANRRNIPQTDKTWFVRNERGQQLGLEELSVNDLNICVVVTFIICVTFNIILIFVQAFSRAGPSN